jgi:hypothetical protein
VQVTHHEVNPPMVKTKEMSIKTKSNSIKMHHSISARRIMDFIFVTYVIPNNQGSCPMNEVIIIITEPIKYFQNLFSECTPVL